MTNINHDGEPGYAVFAGLNATAGNLLHHAVEMCLKGALAKKGKSTDDLKKLRHGLPKIWKEFKAEYREDIGSEPGSDCRAGSVA